MTNKSATGLEANVLILIIFILCVVAGFIPGACYVVWIVPLVFYFVESESEITRFYMLQGTLLYGFNAIITGILSAARWGAGIVWFHTARQHYQPPIGVMGLNLAIAMVNLFFAIVAIICVIKAWKYEYFKIPVVFPIARSINAAISKK